MGRKININNQHLQVRRGRSNSPVIKQNSPSLVNVETNTKSDQNSKPNFKLKRSASLSNVPAAATVSRHNETNTNPIEESSPSPSVPQQLIDKFKPAKGRGRPIKVSVTVNPTVKQRIISKFPLKTRKQIAEYAMKHGVIKASVHFEKLWNKKVRPYLVTQIKDVYLHDIVVDSVKNAGKLIL